LELVLNKSKFKNSRLEMRLIFSGFLKQQNFIHKELKAAKSS